MTRDEFRAAALAIHAPHPIDGRQPLCGSAESAPLIVHGPPTCPACVKQVLMLILETRR